LPYVQSKIKTEKYLLETHKKNGLPLVILRPADVYGPYDRTSCVPIVKGLEDGLPPIVGRGHWIFPLCYVDNLSLSTYLACITQERLHSHQWFRCDLERVFLCHTEEDQEKNHIPYNL